MNRTNNTQGSEDTTQAQRNMASVAEGHEALEAHARRVEATAPATTDRPIQGMGDQAATGSEDNSQNVRAMREVAENTRAMKEQARRVDATLPPEINKVGPQS
jgi:methyl-accepting chemotaxis protein